MSKKLVLNSLSGTVLYLVNIVVAFIMSPIIIRALGNRDYGLWELVMSVIGYMGLLDLGIGPALVRFVSVADGRKDREDLQKIISTSTVFFVVVGVVAALVFFVLGYHSPLIAGNEAQDIANLSTVFLLLGLNAGMTFPLQVFIATLMGVQRHCFINNVRIVLLIARAVLSYHLLLSHPGKGLLIMALLEPAFTALQVVAFVGAVHLDRNIPNIAWAAVSWNKAREMISFGAKSATMLVASRLQSQSVPLIIGNTLGLGQIVYFVMPNRLVDYARGLSLAIGFPLTPWFGSTVGRGNHDELVRAWLNSTLVLQSVSFAMAVMILFAGEPFLRIWIGGEYADAGRAVLYILVTGLVADALNSNGYRILTSLGRHGSCTLAWLVLSALSIPLGIVGAYSFGIPGVAFAVTMVTVAGHIVTVYLACRAMNIPLRTYLSETVSRLLIPIALLTGTFMLMRYLCYPDSYLLILTFLLCGMGVYLGSVWLYTLKPEGRNSIVKRFRSTFSGSKL